MTRLLGGKNMAPRYAHTNITAEDWRRLASFYQEAFGCEPVPPERNQSGTGLETGTGVVGAVLQGVHPRLPGYGGSGPTLENYSYGDIHDKPEALPNRKGFGHIAFVVDDVQRALDLITSLGGRAIGKITSTEVVGVGHPTFVYAADPEDIILELQHWS